MRVQCFVLYANIFVPKKSRVWEQFKMLIWEYVKQGLYDTEKNKIYIEPTSCSMYRKCPFAIDICLRVLKIEKYI